MTPSAVPASPTSAAYTAASDLCDLIMQGGITSGVVYPRAVLKLAGRYRFRSIGGTSAGAIAAAATAAAELGRSKEGFERLEKVPGELARYLSSFFQPVRPFRGAFSLFIACVGNRTIFLKIASVLVLLTRHFSITILIGLSPVAIYLVRTWGTERGGWEDAAICAVAISGVLFALLGRFLGLLLYSLPRKDFGICPGLRTRPSARPALTEWMTDLFDKLADINAARPAPLLFGDLDGAGIQLKMMTTNLSARRPYSLPFATRQDAENENRYVFREKEWEQLFPPRVMNWLLKDEVSRKVPGQEGYRFLPESDQLPVAVAVRMSLSFPVLLAAIPLYRRDPLYKDAWEQKKLRRCVFSDGGISSNFPIHFFDAFLPNRPTFAIALESYSPLRLGEDTPENRVYMPQLTPGGYLLPIQAVSSLGDFIGAIVDSARLWPDNLQKLLSGYRERIAHVALNDFEGGLNLNMSPQVIGSLGVLGDIAGKFMLNFNLPEHRWHRFLVAYARLEESCELMNKAYATGFEEFLSTYPPNTLQYRPTQAWLDKARARLDSVLKLTDPWASDPLRKEGKIPKPETDLRITPKP